MDVEAILRYMVQEEPEVNEEELAQVLPASDLEEILALNETKLDISSKVGDEEASNVFNEFLADVVEQEKKVKVVYYQASSYIEDDNGLYSIQDSEGTDYLFVPHNVSVQRVSQNTLGPNVLGRTWLGTGFIEILDTLYGASFEEVLLHEINHLLYPQDNEREIRERTKKQLRYPIFH